MYWDLNIKPTTKPCVATQEEFDRVIDFFKGGNFRIGNGDKVWQLFTGKFVRHAGWDAKAGKTYRAGVVFLRRRNEKGEIVRTTTHLNRIKFVNGGDDPMAK